MVGLEERRLSASLRIALAVLPIYLAAYPADTRLLEAIDAPGGVEIVESIMLRVGDEATSNPNREAAKAQHRAGYALEAIWLALQPEPDLDEVTAAAKAAVSARQAFC